MEASSRQREMGRAMQRDLVATAGFSMKNQCILVRMAIGTVCSLLYKHQDSHSLGEEINALKYNVCLTASAFFTISSHLSHLCPIEPR